MIYLLRKYDIISVPSYAAGIYHRTKCDIIPQVYHPFRQGTDIIEKSRFLSKPALFMVEARPILLYSGNLFKHIPLSSCYFNLAEMLIARVPCSLSEGKEN